MGRTFRFSPLRLVTLLAFVALLVAMVLSTRFVTPDELASLGPEEFDPQATSQGLFDEASQELPKQADPLPDVLSGLRQDVAKAAKEYDAAQPNDTTYIFAVSGEGEVTGKQGPSLELKVSGVPAETPVSMAMGPAINGTVLRDHLGFEFGDAPNQTAYQRVGDDLKGMIQQQMGQQASQAPVGSTVEFVGLLSVTDTGIPMSPAKPVQIQPVTVEVRK